MALTWTTEQQTVAASDGVVITWLFTVSTTGGTTYYWATDSVSYGGQVYSAVVPRDTFSGVSLKRLDAENLRISANTVSFGVVEGVTSPDSFLDASVTIRLLARSGSSTVVLGSWLYTVVSVTYAYALFSFSCVDALSRYIEGVVPGALTATVFPDINAPSDNYIIPRIWGQVYIPCRPVWCQPSGRPSPGRYYLLGPSGSYTVTEISEPAEVSHGVRWTSGFSVLPAQGTDGNWYSVLEAIIADANADGTPDSQGLWFTNRLLDAPVRYSSSSTVSRTNPATVIADILTLFGVPSSVVDVSSMSSIYTSRGYMFAGGAYIQEARSALLARLLVQAGATLQRRDVLYLAELYATVSATLAESDVIRGSFSINAVQPIEHDSSQLLYRLDSDPWDSYQSYIVDGTGTTNKPSGAQYLFDFVHLSDTTKPYKTAKLSIERTLGLKYVGRLSVGLRHAFLEPYDVINIDSGLYTRGYYEIDSVLITPSGQVQLAVRQFRHSLLNYGDITGSFTIAASTTPVGGITSTQDPSKIDGGQIATETIETECLIDEAVTESKIKDGAVTTPKIRDYAITALKIASKVISATHIADGAIGSTQLANYAITASKMASLSFGTWTLSSGSKISVNYLGAIECTSSGAISFVTTSGNGYIAPSGSSLIMYAPSNAEIKADNLYLKSSGGITLLIVSLSSYIIFMQHAYPQSDAYVRFGSATQAWLSVHSRTVYYRTLSQFDDYDDIALIRSMRGVRTADGRLRIDPDTAPLELTNIDELADDLSKKHDITITSDDIKQLKIEKQLMKHGKQLKWDDVKKYIAFSAGDISGLCLGAIKQLADRMDALEEMIDAIYRSGK